jgi:DNA-binding winged helix-turn-helix (wHTH) protein/TolB-like protein
VSSKRRYELGEFTFDADSGELRRSGADEEPHRLPPQPARLLALLVDKRGDLVTREEIRGALWPDTQVDFERSLHFCIRQVRAALGDTATDSNYIETLPRRGYRLIPPVRRIDTMPLGEMHDGHPLPGAPGPGPVQEQRDVQAGARRWPFILGLLVATGAVGLGLWVSLFPSPSVSERPLRIGIMPFRPPPAWPNAGDVSTIAEWILEDLAAAAGSRAGIVGPTSTAAYDGSSKDLRRLAVDYDLDYVVNGRFLEREDGPRVLAELIRVADGVHVWVEGYDDLDDGRRLGVDIAANVTRELGLR